MSPRPVDSASAILARLLAGEDVPKSAFGSVARRRLEPLFFTQAVQEERRGGGRVIRMTNRGSVDRFVAAEYPGGLFWESASPSEFEATVKTKNSKRGHAEFHVVLMRGSGQLVFPDGYVLDFAPSQNAPGCVSFLLGDAVPRSHGIRRLVLVENLRLVPRFKEFCPEADAALWTAGKLPEAVIAWLASDAWQGTSFIHAGDYDPVGVREFERLYAQLGERVTLHLPDNLAELFCHASKKLLDQQDSSRLRSQSSHPDAGCRLVVSLILEHGAGLEQQAILGV